MGTSVSKRGLGSLVRALLVVAVAGLLVFAGTFVVVIVADQTRPVPEPTMIAETPAPEPARGADLAAAGPATVDSSPVAVGADPGERADELSRPERLPGWEAQHFSLEELQERFRLVPDPSALPEDLRPIADDLNRAMDDLTSMLLALDRGSAAMTWEEFNDEYRRLRTARYDLDDRYDDRFTRDQRREYIPRERRRAWYNAVAQMRLKAAVRHEEWEKAAISCARLGGYVPRDPYWWPREVYYWRKAGLSGRSKLAYRSSDLLLHDLGRIGRRAQVGLERQAEEVLALPDAQAW